MTSHARQPKDVVPSGQAGTKSLVPTQEGLVRYLGSGLFPYIGPARAAKIVQAFGARTLDVLNSTPERLLKVCQISRDMLNRMLAVWQRYRDGAPIRIILMGCGLSIATAERVIKQWGAQAVSRIVQDPYELMGIWGIGFARADQIAAWRGITGAHPHRVAAGVVAALTDASRVGHCYLPRAIVVQKVHALTGAEPSCIETAIDAASRWVLRGDRVYLPKLEKVERQVEERLLGLLARPPVRAAPVEWPSYLTADQRAAAELALRQPISVLTGLPGTGKTTTVRAILEAAEDQGLQVELAAPTGKAAKRLTETAGAPAQTIHRLLEFHPEKGWRRNAMDPISADLVIVDEASMIDVDLMDKLLDAIDPARTRLLLVGDHHQLPSVGPGRVLRDCLESAAIPATALTEIQRQAADSGIIQLAHHVHRGRWPAPETWRWPDCQFIEASADRCVDIVTRVAAELRHDGEVQVLSPMRKRPAGVDALNAALKAALNPAPSWTWQGWSPGDRVMQTRNNYDLHVMNGEVGVVEARRFDPDAGEEALEVRFDDRVVAYPLAALDELVPAWATTIHKAQGSEWPCVIVVLTMAHYVMLRRELLYTAMTRARRRLVLVGESRAYACATRNDQEQHRYSGLFRRVPVPA